MTSGKLLGQLIAARLAPGLLVLASVHGLCRTH